MGQKLIQLSICLVLIIQLCQASVLDCNFSTGSCSVNSISDVTSANEQITVNGKPADFVDTTTYSLSFMAPTNLYYVPTGLFSIFPNIHSFSMDNVSLNHLVTDAFTNAGNLGSLNIVDNNFPELPASFCSSCINVTSLSMWRNNIVNVSADALKGMKFLNNIMLRENKITCIPPGLFQNTPVLQMIDLASNEITALDRNTFKTLPNLNSIMLSTNKIASIPDLDFTLTGMSMGLNLMLDNNPVMAIHPQFLTHFYSTRIGYSSPNINFYDSYGNLTTCLPKNNMYTSSISSWSWPMANVSLEVCYANWTPELELTPVSCASTTISTTTEAATTTEKTEGDESGEDFHHWGLKKNFFAIISNAMRNFTANVQFQ
ncbi:leucine-rich repeat-containing protein 15-like [Chironomus tepperi]|uniref:leucine-rich repeat-containing protein 15-like n=1 Tax=Chironomus tepperi TaxID=113505 RepID=UPI00391FC3CF